MSLPNRDGFLEISMNCVRNNYWADNTLFREIPVEIQLRGGKKVVVGRGAWVARG